MKTLHCLVVSGKIQPCIPLLHNVGPTSKTLGRRSTNAIGLQMCMLGGYQCICHSEIRVNRTSNRVDNMDDIYRSLSNMYT